MDNSLQKNIKYKIAFGVLIALIFVWPFIISNGVVKPKIERQKEILQNHGITLKVEESEGYFKSSTKYTLTVENRDKFITFLSKNIKVDENLLLTILPQNDDVLGLQFQGNIETKVWKPLYVSVYIVPENFPSNQKKLLEYKEILNKIGASFVFWLNGTLKEVAFDDIQLDEKQQDLNMALSFIKPLFKLGEVKKLSLEKYFIKTTELDKNIILNSNNPQYAFEYKNDYNFKFTSKADDFLYQTKYNLKNVEDYTVYLANKITANVEECESVRCIKEKANEILEDEIHIDSFEIYLGSRIIDGIRYNTSSNQTFEIRQLDSTKNLEYKITYTKENFKIPNVEIKTAKNNASLEVLSDTENLSIESFTNFNTLFIKTANYSVEANKANIQANLIDVKLDPIKYIIDNTEQLSSFETDGFSPLLTHIIEIANYGGKLQYKMNFTDFKFSKVDYPIKNLMIDADFVLKKNTYNMLNQPNELLNFITFTMGIKVDKEAFHNYQKSSLNEYKNLDKVVKFDGDTAILDINFNLKDDLISVNGQRLIK